MSREQVFDPDGCADEKVYWTPFRQPSRDPSHETRLYDLLGSPRVVIDLKLVHQDQGEGCKGSFIEG